MTISAEDFNRRLYEFNDLTTELSLRAIEFVNACLDSRQHPISSEIFTKHHIASMLTRQGNELSDLALKIRVKGAKLRGAYSSPTTEKCKYCIQRSRFHCCCIVRQDTHTCCTEFLHNWECSCRIKCECH